MDFRDSPQDAEYRAQVRSWLEENVSELGGWASLTMEERLPAWRAWQKQLHAAGYAGLAWPERYGGQDASLVQQAIFLEEYDRAGAPDRLNTF